MIESETTIVQESEPAAEAVRGLPAPSSPPGIEAPPQQKVHETRSVIEYAEMGGLVLKTFEDIQRVAKMYCDSKLVPQSFDTPAKVMVAMQLCSERGWKFMNTIGNLMVLNGRISMWGDLPLSLCYNSGQLEKFEEHWIDKAGNKTEDLDKIFGATCTAQRKGFSPVTRKFTMDDAIEAGLASGNVWKKYRKRMLQMRARGWVLKDTCPDIMNGLTICEYDHNTIGPESIPTTGRNISSGAAELNMELGA